MMEFKKNKKTKKQIIRWSIISSNTEHMHDVRICVVFKLIIEQLKCTHFLFIYGNSTTRMRTNEKNQLKFGSARRTLSMPFFSRNTFLVAKPKVKKKTYFSIYLARPNKTTINIYLRKKKIKKYFNPFTVI